MSNLSKQLQYINIIRNRIEQLQKLQQLQQLINTIPPGITNFGNTCYYNSIIQLLYRIIEVKEFITNNKIRAQYKNDSFIHNIIGLLSTMKLNTMATTDNKALLGDEEFEGIKVRDFVNFCVTSLFGGFGQQDAQQFMQVILSSLGPDCPNSELNIDNTEMNKVCIKDINNNIVLSKKFPDYDPRSFLNITNEQYHYLIEKTPNVMKGNGDAILQYGRDNFNEFKKHYTVDRKELKKITITDKFVQLKINNGNNKYNIEQLIEATYNPFINNQKNDLFIVENNDSLYIETFNYIPNKYVLFHLWGSERVGFEARSIDNSEKLEFKPENIVNNQIIKKSGNITRTLTLESGFVKGKLIVNYGDGTQKETSMAIVPKYNKIIHKVKLENNGIMNFKYYIGNVQHTKQYELIGISYHSGESLGSGHYIANVKYGNNWYNYNDNVVNQINSYDKSYVDPTYTGSICPYIALYVEKNGPINYIDPNTVPDKVIDYLVDV